MPANPATGAAVEPLTSEVVDNDVRTKILLQLPTPKGVQVAVSSAYWPNIAGLPDVVKGVVDQWNNRDARSLRVTWTEADGSRSKS